MRTQRTPLSFLLLVLRAAAASDCETFVAAKTGVTNSACRTACDACDQGDSAACSTLESNCGSVSWTQGPSLNVAGDPCFSDWIYGYVRTDGGNSQNVGYKRYENVASPYECQEYCQLDADCANWAWCLPQPTDPNKQENCFLKNKLMMQMAWLGSGSFNTNYCNIMTGTTCYDIKTHQCLGENSCIWCAAEYLSGPPVCSKDTDGEIKPGGADYPWCDGESHPEYSTTPDPQNPTRPPNASTYPTSSPQSTSPPTTTASTAKTTAATTKPVTTASTAASTSSATASTSTAKTSTATTSTATTSTSSATGSTSTSAQSGSSSTSTQKTSSGGSEDDSTHTSGGGFEEPTEKEESSNRSTPVALGTAFGGVAAAGAVAFMVKATWFPTVTVPDTMEGAFDDDFDGGEDDDRNQAVHLREDEFA